MKRTPIYPTNTIDWESHPVTLTWIRINSLEDFSPITQVYGICFDTKERILVCHKPVDKDWHIPGGTPNQGESPEETLRREFFEEVDVSIKNPRILGVQRVDFPDNPSTAIYKKEAGNLFFQVRYICELDELLPQTPDPDNGLVWARRFVPSGKITEYIKWGKTGAAMFKDAIKLREEIII